MIVRILSDKQNNFDGMLRAQFINNDTIHELKFDLDNWEDSPADGMVGGNYLQLIKPTPLMMNFDQEYELSIEDARKIYKTLSEIGWK